MCVARCFKFLYILHVAWAQRSFRPLQIFTLHHLHIRPRRDADRLGLRWISLKSRKEPPDCISVFTAPGAERQREMGKEKEKGWLGISLFPPGKGYLLGDCTKVSYKREIGISEEKETQLEWL